MRRHCLCGWRGCAVAILLAIAVLFCSELAMRPGVSASAIAFTAQDQSKIAEEAARLNEEAVKLVLEGRYDEAIPLAERLLILLEKEIGKSHIHYVSALINLASFHQAKKDERKAKQLCQEALALIEEIPLAQTQKGTELLTNLAVLFRDQRDFRRAELLYQRALEIVEKNSGPDHPNAAAVLSSLAFLHKDKKDYAKATSLFQRVLTIVEKASGHDHPNVASALSNLAGAYRDGGEYQKAEQAYQRALMIVEEVFGPENPNVEVVLRNLAEVYLEEKRYGQAESNYKRVLAIAEKTFGADQPSITPALNNLASVYMKKGDYEQALVHSRRALAIAESKLGANHPDTVILRKNVSRLADASKGAGKVPDQRSNTSLKAPSPVVTAGSNLPQNIGQAGAVVLSSASGASEMFDTWLGAYNRLNTLVKEGRYGEAIPLARSLVNHSEKMSGSRHRHVAIVLTRLAYLHVQVGDPDKAVPHYLRALEIYEKGEHRDPDYAVSILQSLGHLYSRKGNYVEAESLFTRALTMQEKLAGADHVAVTKALVPLAYFYRERGEIEKAEQLYLRAQAIVEKSSKNERELTYVLVHLGWHYESKGDYLKAETFYQRAIAIRETTQGKDPSYLALALINLADLHRIRNDYANAEPIYQRALALIEKSLGPEHAEVIWSMGGLAKIYGARGEHDKAEMLYRRILAVMDKTFGPENLRVAWVVGNLASHYVSKGDYASAEPLYRRVLAITERALGPEHPQTADTLLDLGVLYKSRGDQPRAEPFYKRALEITEKAFGPDHPDVAAKLHMLASLYLDEKKYSLAESMYRRALAIEEKAMGPTSIRLAPTLTQLGELYRTQKDYARAEPFYLRSLDIREKAFGAEHPDLTWALNGLAELSLAKGEYEKAESYFLRSLAILEKARGADSPMMAWMMGRIAALYLAKGDIAKAIDFRMRNSEIIERNISLNLAAGSERQKLLFLSTFSERTSEMVSLHVQSAPDHPQARQLALATILGAKGRTLDVMTDSVGALRRRLNPQDRSLLDQMIELRSHLAGLVLGGPGQAEPTQHQARIDKLSEEVETLEAEIALRGARMQKQSPTVSPEAIQAAIPPDAALVEIAVYRPFSLRTDAKEPQRYVAYVLFRQGGPKWVDLGEAKPIDAAIGKMREALRDPKRGDARRLARALDERVMQPIRKLLGATRGVFLSPDGLLNLIPFAALIDEQDRYLVEQYSFTYLTSGRDLLRLQASTVGAKEPLVIADPDFGDPSIGSESRSSNSSAISAALANARFTPLAGTAEEAQALQSILPRAKLLTRGEATETALKQHVNPGILHIATHGFFLEDAPTDGAVEPNQRLLLLQQSKAAKTEQSLQTFNPENPLLRSGLGLAGANLRKSGNDDGILTAYEVAGLNLAGTKLAVLSACDTGIGEVKNGEGVYGLRRALVLAGSETQVMSLWPVSDKGTRDLMIEYYKALQAGQGRGEALRQVQLQMLADPKRQHPYYWASFIVSGEWANLDGKR